MAQLVNKSKDINLLKDLKVATGFLLRAKGLIGCKQLAGQSGIWFPDCNWIHTLFMSIAIDVIYLDKNMKVYKLEKNLKPWKISFPVFRACSVVEMKAGFIDNHRVEIGDVLDVGS